MTKSVARLGLMSATLLLAACDPPKKVMTDVYDRTGPSWARPSPVCAPASLSAPDFVLYNDIRDPIVEFRTLPPGQACSANWLGVRPIAPGASRGLLFSRNANAVCRRQYLVRVESGGKWSSGHDFRKNAGIHVTARGLVGTRN